eukprot:21244_1
MFIPILKYKQTFISIKNAFFQCFISGIYSNGVITGYLNNITINHYQLFYFWGTKQLDNLYDNMDIIYPFIRISKKSTFYLNNITYNQAMNCSKGTKSAVYQGFFAWSHS